MQQLLDFLSANWVIITIISAVVLWIIGSIFFYRLFFKRLYDIIFALIGLPFFLILFIPIAIMIKLEDKGPLFYCGKRLGKNGKIFAMKKFRSMKVNAPDIRLADGSTYNSDSDPRVTKIGRFLRKTSLDEIPQLLDILLGNMSFIGPRPDLPEAINVLTDEEKIKLRVAPGVTGYSQAYVRNSVPWKQRLEYDVKYAKKLSIFFDIKIFFATLKTVLLKKNLYSEVQNQQIVNPIEGINADEESILQELKSDAVPELEATQTDSFDAPATETEIKTENTDDDISASIINNADNIKEEIPNENN